MIPFRRPLIAALAATAVLAVGAPAASATTGPTYHFSMPTGFGWSQGRPSGFPSVPVGFPAGACSSTSVEGQGHTGGNDIQSCGLLNFIGPSTTVSTVIGPTIIAGAFTGSSIVSGGAVAVGP